MKFFIGISCILIFFAVVGCRTTKHSPVAVKKPEVEKPIDKPVDKPLPVIPNEINFAVILPFDFRKNLNTDTTAAGEISIQSLSNLHFYEGMLMAMDSLKSSGAVVKVNVFDSYLDSISFINLFYKKEVLASDYIICAAQSNYLAPAASVAKKHKNKIVFVQSPMQNHIIKDNNIAWMVLPANYTQSHIMVDFLTDSYKDANFLVVSRDNPREKMWSTFFLNDIKAEFEIKKNASTVSQINYTSTLFDSTTTLVSKLKRNVIVIPSSDEAFVSPLLDKLNRLNMANIVVAGLPTWENFESIDFSENKNLKVLYFSSAYIDENDPMVKNFQRKFYEKYFTLPLHNSFVGFDIAVYLTTKHFQKSFGLQPVLPFEYAKPFENSGFENIYTSIICIEDYKLVRKSKNGMFDK